MRKIGLKKKIEKAAAERKVLWRISLKQLKAKYAGAKLGLWWALITPIILALSISFVFRAVFNVGVPNYTLFVLAGILPWIFLSNTLLETTGSFAANAQLLKQAIFPREFIPISYVISGFLNFLLGFVFLSPWFLLVNPKIVYSLAWLFPLLAFYFGFILGVGICFSVLNVFLRDFSHFLSIALMLWFWVTPVFYSFESLPSLLKNIVICNPVTCYIVLFQDVMFNGKISSMPLFFLAAALSLSALFFGYLSFILVEPKLMKRV